MLTEEQITRFIEESGIVSLKDFLHVERDDITDVLTGIAISKFRARAAASMIMKAADAVAGAGADDEETAAASPPPAPGAAAKTAAEASEMAAEPTESAAAEAEPAVDGSDGWAAANHRQVPLKKHSGEYVRTARSRAALTPRRRCTRFDRRRSPSSLAPLFFPFRRVLRRAPASLQSLARLDGIRMATYVHCAPLLTRALPSLRATSHR